MVRHHATTRRALLRFARIQDGDCVTIGNGDHTSVDRQPRWRYRGHTLPGHENLCIAVTVSVRQFRQSNFVATVTDILAASGARVPFEILNGEKAICPITR